jgi:hypothetical protein
MDVTLRDFRSGTGGCGRAAIQLSAGLDIRAEGNWMQEVMFRICAVILGCGLGAGWGWISSRLFGRSIVQDVSATLMGLLLGSILVIAAEIGALSFGAQGGLAAVSGGLSELVPFSLPLAVLFVAAAHRARRRVGRAAAVPVVLGGLAALLGALWVSTTITTSVG